MWQKAQRLQRIASYHERAQSCYREGLYLACSRWASLAEYEQDRLTHELNRQNQKVVPA